MSNLVPAWFLYIVIFISAATIGITIPNIIYFNNLRSGTSTGITTSQALTMLWLNIILLILAIMLFILTIWMLLRPNPTTKQYKPYNPGYMKSLKDNESSEPTHFIDENGNMIHKDNIGSLATSQDISANTVNPKVVVASPYN